MNDDKQDLDSVYKRMDHMVNILSEFCDGVLILASCDSPDVTSCLYVHRGNFHTVLGLMEDFKLKKLHGWIRDQGNSSTSGDGSEEANAD